jgi:hypothetical protein
MSKKCFPKKRVHFSIVICRIEIVLAIIVGIIEQVTRRSKIKAKKKRPFLIAYLEKF